MTGGRLCTGSAPLFLVESYWPGVSAERVAAADAETQRALEVLGGGDQARYLGSMLVPEDELLLRLFAGGQPALISEANARAGIPVERVVKVLALAPATPADHRIPNRRAPTTRTRPSNRSTSNRKPQ
jgi:hypothetical protein